MNLTKKLELSNLKLLHTTRFEFRVGYLPKLEYAVLTSYQPLARGGRDGFIPLQEHLYKIKHNSLSTPIAMSIQTYLKYTHIYNIDTHKHKPIYIKIIVSISTYS